MKRRTTRGQFRSKKRTGGKRIGEGQYGFVVSPSIPCVGKNTTRKVSKIFKEKSNLKRMYRNRYVPFIERRKALEPVLAKLQELDPEQTMFVYPEFCDEPGPLTNTLRENGVTNDNKANSYLMPYGGISYRDLFSPFFELINTAFFSIEDIQRSFKRGEEMKLAKPNATNANISAIQAETERSIQALERIANRKERANLLFAKLKPLVKRAEVVLNTLHGAGILHGDAHDGNIVLQTNDPSIQEWMSSLEIVKRDIQESDSYKKWSALVGKTQFVFTGYSLDVSQAVQVLNLVDAMKPLDFSQINPKLIDWDAARIVGPELTIELEQENGDLVMHMLPSAGPFWWFNEKYYE